jgi:hypothetical protein
MSWQACSWAGQQTAGNQGRKGLLLVLGNHANPSGVAWPGRGTLAADCECRPATITAQLAALEAAGLLARVRRMRANGSRTTDYLVLGPNAQDRGAMLDAVRGETEDAVADLARLGADTEPRLGSVDKTLGSVSIPPLGYAGGGDQRQLGNTVSGDGQRASARTKPPPDGPPESFPDELRPHANAVLSLLREAAVERGAKAVTVRAVGRVVMDHPRKPLVAAAQSMRAWLLDGNGASAPCKDVVMRYRRWLGGEQDLAASERLDAAGHPAAATRGGSPDVASGRGSSAVLARAMARDRERRRAALEPIS